MGRVKLTIEYDGTNYGGWQLQNNAVTVQGEIERALQELTGHFIRVTGASRTDAGVHARGQVAHFDNDTTIPPERFSYALNTRLPSDIRIRRSEAAPDDFSARFWTKGKTYSYTVYHDQHASALLRDRAWHVWSPLDLDKMREAAKHLLGTHDFAAFCATGGSAKTTVRTLHEITVEEFPDHRVVITVHGEAFLYNMVRIIAGTLVAIGAGDLPVNAIDRMLETGDRTLGGITAPPQGLILEAIEYYDTKPEWVRP